jgi:hypothetical protein
MIVYQKNNDMFNVCDIISLILYLPVSDVHLSGLQTFPLYISEAVARRHKNRAGIETSREQKISCSAVRPER